MIYKKSSQNYEYRDGIPCHIIKTYSHISKTLIFKFLRNVQSKNIRIFAFKNLNDIYNGYTHILFTPYVRLRLLGCYDCMQPDI